jgi:hypothetical protein
MTLHKASAWIMALAAGAAWAQFDPARVKPEPEAVAARFADPDVRYGSPGLRPGRTDFASHAEALEFAEGLARRSRDLKVELLGSSQQGRAMPLLVLAKGAVVNPKLPTVLVLGQQHGNEPAGGEAALALAEQLASAGQAALLERVNVLIVPRANPDGADRFVRTTASGIDVNRDHLLLQTPEGRLLASVAARYKPQVVLDLHEFTVGDRWVNKFGVFQKYDALLQAATVGNMDPGLAAAAQADYVSRIQRTLEAAGQSVFLYHTTSPNVADKVVAMGGVQPDTGRNVGGLRHAVSLLIETRGVGIGRAHFARRVHAHVLAATSVIETAADQGDRLLALVRDAEAGAAASACKGDLVVEAGHTPRRQALSFLDARTGEERSIEVAWRSALELQIRRSRPRPCGYLLAASETQAVERLRALGVRVWRVGEAGQWQVERYLVTAADEGRRQDTRGAIEDGQNIRMLQVRTEPASLAVPAGSLYVPMAQPLAPLVGAALEPDSQNSYVANRLLELEDGRLLRVLAPPAAAMLVWP